MAIWLVGMSGAGKSTLGREVYALIKRELVSTVFVAGAESQFTIVNSSNLEIREHFPAVEQADESAIRNLLQDAALWEAQKAVRADICDKYFANFRGTSSRRAAEILLNLEKVNPAETSP